VTSQHQREKLTSDHERAIGKIVVAWIDYQEVLGQLFAKLFGRKQWALALSAWHTVESDRSQHALLNPPAEDHLG
jgi:hypothetical protein